MKAGVAIAIKTNLPRLTIGIFRINGRTVEITVRCKNPISNLSMINSYAPRIGYIQEAVNSHRGDITALITTIPNKYAKIWRTDNNGQ